MPRGDLVVDYRADRRRRRAPRVDVRGRRGRRPDDKLAEKKNVGIDPKVIDAQRVGRRRSRGRPRCSRCRPKLPRWRESKAHDYVIVVDVEPVDGRRALHARERARGRDRRCRWIAAIGSPRWRATAIAAEARRSARTVDGLGAATLKKWLAAQPPAGASDVVAALRSAAATSPAATASSGSSTSATASRRPASARRPTSRRRSPRRPGRRPRLDDRHRHGRRLDAARGGRARRRRQLPRVGARPVGRDRGARRARVDERHDAARRDRRAAGGPRRRARRRRCRRSAPVRKSSLAPRDLTGDVSGDVDRASGTVAGQTFEQRYPVKLAVSSAAGNGFVPRLWASLAIDQLERDGKGEDRARIVALSQGYGVMSRETSLLVLESQAMFDAFGVDRSQPAREVDRRGDARRGRRTRHDAGASSRATATPTRTRSARSRPTRPTRTTTRARSRRIARCRPR